MKQSVQLVITRYPNEKGEALGKCCAAGEDEEGVEQGAAWAEHGGDTQG